MSTNVTQRNSQKGVLAERTGFFASTLGTMVLDSVFIVGWAAIHYVLDFALNWLYPDLSSTPAMVFWIASWAFDIASWVTIACFLIQDLITAIRRAIRYIRDLLQQP